MIVALGHHGNSMGPTLYDPRSNPRVWVLQCPCMTAKSVRLSPAHGLALHPILPPLRIRCPSFVNCGQPQAIPPVGIPEGLLPLPPNDVGREETTGLSSTGGLQPLLLMKALERGCMGLHQPPVN